MDNHLPISKISIFETTAIVSCLLSLLGTFVVDGDATRGVLIIGACIVMGVSLIAVGIARLRISTRHES